MTTEITVRGSYSAFQLELGRVRPLALADAGMLGAGLHPTAAATETAFVRGGAATDGDAELALAPEDIEVAAVVDGRFVAG